MDYIRDPYIAEMQGYQDYGERFEVRWFPAEEGAKVFEGRSPYRSSYWYDPQDGIPPVGERAPRTYGRNLGGNPLGYLGEQHCGSEQAMRHGGRYGIDPPLDIGIDGNAPCCRRADIVAEGGQLVGGEAVFPGGQRARQKQGGATQMGHIGFMGAAARQGQGGEAIMGGPGLMWHIAKQEQGGEAIMGGPGLMWHIAKQEQGGEAYQGVPFPVPTVVLSDAGTTAEGNYEIPNPGVEEGQRIVIFLSHIAPLFPTPVTVDGRLASSGITRPGQIELYRYEWTAGPSEPGGWETGGLVGVASAWAVLILEDTIGMISETLHADFNLVAGVPTVLIMDPPTLQVFVIAAEGEDEWAPPEPWSADLFEARPAISITVGWVLNWGGLSDFGEWVLDAVVGVDFCQDFVLYGPEPIP